MEHNSLEGIGGIIIPESTSLDIVVAEKGTLWLDFETFGKSAHSTQPHVGINAIEHMMTLLQMVKSTWEAIPYVQDRYLSPPTKKIATISGGVKTNSIPDRCIATVGLRPVPSQNHRVILERLGEMIDELERKMPTFKAEMRVINERQPVATNEKEEIVKVAKEVGRWKRS